MLSVLMQRALGLPWAIVGQVQTLGLSSTLLACALLMWALPRWPSSKKFLVSGFVALAIFGGQLSRLTGNVLVWRDVLPALLFNGVFLMFVMGIVAVHTFRDVQHDEAVLSHAQQLKNMLAQFGTAVGMAASTLMLQWRSSEHYSHLTSRFELGDPVFTSTLQALTQSLSLNGAGQQSEAMALAQLAQQVTQQATLMACLDYFAVIAAIGAVGALVMATQRLMK